MPDRMPNQMSDRRPNNIPDRLSEYVSGRMSNQTSNSMSENVSESVRIDFKCQIQDVGIYVRMFAMVGITQRHVSFFANWFVCKGEFHWRKFWMVTLDCEFVQFLAINEDLLSSFVAEYL